MSELLTQSQLEERMVGMGIQRARVGMVNAEARGEAAQNPYAATIYREFVEPLKDVIERDLSATGAGQRQAHVKLLKGMDTWAVAYLAVRTLLNSCLVNNESPTVRRTGYSLGRAVHMELYLQQFEMLEPDLYHVLASELGRRQSTSVTHRINVFKAEQRKHGFEFVEWSIGAREQVGMYLLDNLITLGMVDMEAPPTGPGRRVELGVSLTQPVLDVIQNIKGFVEITQPVYSPCVAPPKDWVAFNDGGFHTTRMRRAHPFLVKASSTARERLQTHSMPKVYAAINHLQKTAWRVNTGVLDAVLAVSEHRNVGEIATLKETDKPARPEWLAYHEKGTDMTSSQMAEFIAWKHIMAAWYTKQKLEVGLYRRFYGATRTAEFMRDYPELYFVWFADSRGRLYPLTQGISPQGSDLQKGLLQFAHPKALGSDDGVRWFLINGANKFGFDNAPLDERAEWFRDKVELIVAAADNPVDNLFWTEADNPVQFLAWCFEFREFWNTPDKHKFESSLPVALDGSCNGLQHYSAMLRDEVGGKATNLTQNKQREDIYKTVANVATVRMQESTNSEDETIRNLWLQHGVNRKLTKRSVMTTPYGVTKRSAVKYIIEDYLVGGNAPCFSRDVYYAAANVAMNYVWPAIGEVVIKAREAMDWLRKQGRMLGKHSESGVVFWTSLSGFLASQTYYKQEEHFIRTKLYGHARIKVVTEAPETSDDRHATSMAPNFVHSCDAAHLHLTTVAMAGKGVLELAMIHDDYGCHAADAELLFHTIRSEFVSMYSNGDPLVLFTSEHSISDALPSKGNLNLDEVLQSEHFFS